jgi:hypothetical protein
MNTEGLILKHWGQKKYLVRMIVKRHIFLNTHPVH